MSILPGSLAEVLAARAGDWVVGCRCHQECLDQAEAVAALLSAAKSAVEWYYHGWPDAPIDPMWVKRAEAAIEAVENWSKR
ncbi:MAG: hypothetical protein WC551_08995 [Patescibacteria group bacterium]